MFELNESLAGTGKSYVVAQVRPKGGRVHFQVEGKQVNRDYGWAFDLPYEGFGPLNALFLNDAETVPSLAGTDARYLEVQIRPRSGGVMHVQAESNAPVPASPARRAYGVACDLQASTEILQQLAGIIVTSE